MKRFFIVTAAAAVAFLSISGPPAAADANANKEVICHIPPGNPSNAHTIVVSENALPAHMAHGDTEGPCPSYPPAAGTLIAPGTVAPRARFQATFEGCPGGESAHFVLNGKTMSASCNVPAGPTGFRRPSTAALPSATATLVAPKTPGTYAISATGTASGLSANATITVVAATPEGLLRTTGSGRAPIVQVAPALFAVGAGLTVVGLRRRRAHA